MFLDDTACNLASINLQKFRKSANSFDIEAFEHACRLWTVTLEISVTMAQFPSKSVAERSHAFRTLGLGFANLGGLLMSSGIPYDSDEGRAAGAAIAAIMTGCAYRTSAELATALEPFPAYEKNAESMLRVLRNHARAAAGIAEAETYEDLNLVPMPLQAEACPFDGLPHRAEEIWGHALAAGIKHGFRNAQVSVIAPTGTIGLLMDCDTTGIEPDFALVKYKSLAGGGHLKIINAAVPEALTNLGYSEQDIRMITDYALGRGTLKGSPALGHEALRTRDLVDIRDETHAANSRRGWNGPAIGLIIQGHIAGHDRKIQSSTRLAHALNGCHELAHDFRAFRIPKIQAIGYRQRIGTARGEIAPRLAYGLLTAFIGVRFAIARGDVGSDCQCFAGSMHAYDGRIGQSIGAGHCIRHDVPVILFPYPSF